MITRNAVIRPAVKGKLLFEGNPVRFLLEVLNTPNAHATTVGPLADIGNCSRPSSVLPLLLDDQ